jgi:hypothetical protein
MDTLRAVVISAAVILSLASFVGYFIIIDRLDSIGYDLGFWFWVLPWKHWSMYFDYWDIAPRKGWSRIPVILCIGAPLVLIVVLIFLSSS